MVFCLCSFTILVPLNFLNTIDSPEFVAYMGIGRCDIRIDFRPGEEGRIQFDRMIRYLEEDPEVELRASFVTYRCRIRTEEGDDFNLNVETGDHSIFPLEFLEGRSPRKDSEIALSLLNAKELGVVPGDRVRIAAGKATHPMEVCGIYQDVTNGGYTAKSLSLFSREAPLWYAFSLDLGSGVSTDRKIQEYSGAFPQVRVTDTRSYLEQTLGETIALLEKIGALAVTTALLSSLLVASLFLRMILARDSSQIAIMRGIGFSGRDIGRQYLYKSLLVLISGIVVGTLAANSMGQKMVSALWSLMGASQIRFIVDPFTAYVLVPVLLVLLVSLTVLRALSSNRDCSIADLNAE